MPGPETYTLFRPEEVLSGDRSTQIRRLEADMAELCLDDVYGGLTLQWQIDRNDVNEPHGNQWNFELAVPDLWVSTDTGKVCFAPVAAKSKLAVSEAGQHHKEVGGEWCHFTDVEQAPGNLGGFHCCCVDTLQPGTDWTLVAKLADFGLVLGREAGLRVEFAALVRNNCEAIIASLGAHDECRSLFSVGQVSLPSGKIMIADPAEVLNSEGQEDCDGLAVPSGMGAGYYPIFVSRDTDQKICRVTVVFHSDRAAKVSKHFPPVLGEPT